MLSNMLWKVKREFRYERFGHRCFTGRPLWADAVFHGVGIVPIENPTPHIWGCGIDIYVSFRAPKAAETSTDVNRCQHMSTHLNTSQHGQGDPHIWDLHFCQEGGGKAGQMGAHWRMRCVAGWWKFIKRRVFTV